MRNLAIVVVVLIVFTSSVAHAGEIEDALSAIAQGWVVEQAGRWADRELNNERTVCPAPAPGQLGVVRIVMGDRCGWYGRSDTLAIARQTLQSVGFQVVDETAREVATEEAELGGYAGLEPAYYVAVISLWEGDGGWLDSEVRRASGRYGVERESVYAHLIMQVSRGGVIMASTEVEASDSATSIDVSTGWCNGFRLQTQHPTRQDLAVVAACQKAANNIASQLAPTTGWNFDPQTGEPISPAPVGWRYDPYTGRPLGQNGPTENRYIPVPAR